MTIKYLTSGGAMIYQFKKSKLFMKLLFVNSSIFVLDKLTETLNLSLLLGFVMIISACFVYFLMRTQNDVYEIKGGSMKLKKARMEVPVSEIKELTKVKIPLLHSIGIKNEKFGYHYFFSYDGHHYELLMSCKNDQNVSIVNALQKKIKKDYREMDSMKQFVKKVKGSK